MPGPLHSRLIARAGATRNYLVASVLVGAVTAGLLIVQAGLVADAVTTVFDTLALPEGWAAMLLLLLAVFAARGALAWLNAWLAHRSAAAVKSQLRRDVMAARLATPVGGASSATVMRVVTQGLDALDGYFSKYLPQLGLAVTVPFIVGAAILWADWPSAIIVAFTLPLIPVFMALIGLTTAAATRTSFGRAERLARHFADLIAGLPTLQAFARARAQRRGVAVNEEGYRDATMRTLRISFLSSFALELLATLSVAVVAVTVGFRVAYGQVDFSTALFVLILAPEAFLPVRQVGVHFHDSADGVAAADAAFAIIDAAPIPAGSHHALRDEGPPPSKVAHPLGSPENEPRPAESRQRLGVSSPLPARRDDRHAPSPAAISHTEDIRHGEPSRKALAAEQQTPPLVALEEVTYRYPTATADALTDFSLRIQPGEIVALAGPSGAGKSTALALVAGFLRPASGRVLVDGTDLVRIPPAPWRERVAWVAQEPGMINGTVGDNVALGHRTASPDDIAEALRDTGADFGADKHVGDDAEGLSAGERRRVALARALLRIRVGTAELLLLDEPTAGLDADTESVVIEAVRASGAGALIVTHRPAVLAAADRVVEWDPAPFAAQSDADRPKEAR